MASKIKKVQTAEGQDLVAEIRGMLQSILADGEWGTNAAKERDFTAMPKFLRERRETVTQIAKLLGLLQETEKPAIQAAIIMLPPTLPPGSPAGDLSFPQARIIEASEVEVLDRDMSNRDMSMIEASKPSTSGPSPLVPPARRRILAPRETLDTGLDEDLE